MIMTREQAAALTDLSRAEANQLAQHVLCKFCWARPVIGKYVYIQHMPGCPSHGAKRRRAAS
jgi:hypothetical protein